jgi:hypothetical protein
MPMFRGGETEREERGMRLYAVELVGLRDWAGGGALCKRAMSWAVAADVMSIGNG